MNNTHDITAHETAIALGYYYGRKGDESERINYVGIPGVTSDEPELATFDKWYALGQNDARNPGILDDNDDYEEEEDEA